MNTYRPEGLIGGTDQNRALLYSGVSGLEKAMATGAIIESRVMLCDKDMNLHVDLRGIVGIIPREEVCYSPSNEEVKDIAIITRVGKPVCFKVTSIEIKNGKTVAYLSRRAAQLDCYNNYVCEMLPGDILEAKVTHLETFGAFVDIGCGLIALLPVDCISVSRFSHPKDRLNCGKIIYTVLKSIDREKGRVFVTMRELLGTWEENAERFSPGQTVSGIIRSVENYGIFVELAPNLAGLAELKDDISASSIVAGRRAAVYIKSIIPERMKIKLVLIDCFDNDRESEDIEYFINLDNTKRLSHWLYSPRLCHKVVETVFEDYPT